MVDPTQRVRLRSNKFGSKKVVFFRVVNGYFFARACLVFQVLFNGESQVAVRSETAFFEKLLIIQINNVIINCM